MTQPPEQITIECPKCGNRFQAWFRASINLSLGDMTEKDVERNETKRCPKCKQKIILDALVVEEDGTWRVDGGWGGVTE